jgi:hypothetical protein
VQLLKKLLAKKNWEASPEEEMLVGDDTSGALGDVIMEMQAVNNGVPRVKLLKLARDWNCIADLCVAERQRVLNPEESDSAAAAYRQCAASLRGLCYDPMDQLSDMSDPNEKKETR